MHYCKIQGMEIPWREGKEEEGWEGYEEEGWEGYEEEEKEGEGGRTYFSIGVVAIVPHNFSFYTHLPHGICPC
jgi:hypothetical protein